MQIFLPYADFRKSLQTLDNKRLGKQRVETYQIISAISRRPKLDGSPYKGWLNHPCTVMWKEYLPALKLYMNYSIDEWVQRGFKNTMQIYKVEQIMSPKWVGMEMFHSAHRSNLLRKDYNYYSKFGWEEPIDLPYIWPSKNNLV